MSPSIILDLPIIVFARAKLLTNNETKKDDTKFKGTKEQVEYQYMLGTEKLVTSFKTADEQEEYLFEDALEVELPTKVESPPKQKE
mgnify:CR=1 FL=1